MALGLVTESSGGGDFTPIVKMDARAGRVFRIDRTQKDGRWDTQSVDITADFTAIWDMENIEVGWAYFAAGAAPSWAMVPLGSPLPAKPSDLHKQAFRLQLKLGKTIGGDVREFGSQAKAVIGAVDKLHSEYEAGLKSNPGKLPIVTMTGSVPIVSQGSGLSSTNYMPQLEIVGWTARPTDLGGTETAEVDPPKTPPKTKTDVSQEF